MGVMSRSIHLIGGVVLTIVGLTSPVIAQDLPPRSSIPTIEYEIDTGALLNGAPYISGFECLVLGENIVRKPACDYYKAAVSSSQTLGKTSEEICFKELTVISDPRIYKAEMIYRIIVETKPRKHGGFIKGITLARIVSNDPYPYPKSVLNPNKWHETTTIALYDCAVPYNGKSYN